MSFFLPRNNFFIGNTLVTTLLSGFDFADLLLPVNVCVTFFLFRAIGIKGNEVPSKGVNGLDFIIGWAFLLESVAALDVVAVFVCSAEKEDEESEK